MNYCICDQALVPVRIQPGERYEMINQLLFGDVMIVKDKHSNWLLIETADDNYDGWVDEKQINEIDKSEYNDLLTTNRHYVMDLATSSKSENDYPCLILPMGSRLPRFDNNKFSINGNCFIFKGEIFHSINKADRNGTIEIAKKYLGAPYLWGGRSPFGIDCSGFVQLVFKISGFFLPRDSSQQVLQGKTINFIHEAKTGDLAFFGEEDGNIVHVGIFIDENHIIHASGKVRIDKIDHQGIFNVDTQQYTHRLRVIKSLFD